MANDENTQRAGVVGCWSRGAYGFDAARAAGLVAAGREKFMKDKMRDLFFLFIIIFLMICDAFLAGLDDLEKKIRRGAK
jgi:hypothetical protein